ncbi:tRNA adenosine(34) deaminase TadA [soil metagenome]
MIDHDAAHMHRALALAQAAAAAGEAPIGAVRVDPVTNAVVGEGANRPIAACDPTAHAEIEALRAGGAGLGNYRLTGLTLYVTLEPCPMCAGAISHARIGRLVFGASDPKGGGVLHGARVFDHPQCHSRPAVEHGLMAEESAGLLKTFFKLRRGRPLTPPRDAGT